MKKTLLIINFLTVSLLANAQWINQNVPIGYEGYLYDVEVVDSNSAWGVLWDATASSPYTQQYARTADGGNTWIVADISSLSLDNVICNVWPIDSSTAYLCTFNGLTNVGGRIYKTTDGGMSWMTMDTTMFTTSTSFPDFVYFWNAAQGMAMGDPASTPIPKKYEIYLTNDSGATWTRVPNANMPALTNSLEYGITNLFTAAQGYVWFGTTYGAIHRSRDGGLTWTKAATGLPANTVSGSRQDIMDLAFTDSLNGVVLQITSTGSAFLRNTYDAGTTWTNVSWVGSIGTLDIDAIPGTNILISTGTTANPDTGITAFSIDNGLTWTIFDSIGSHTAVDFANPLAGWTGQYVLGTGTGGAWKYGEDTPLGYVIKYAESKETQVFPNPTAGRINVIGSSDSRETTFRVYDMQGKMVINETIGTPSTYNHVLNLENLSSGFYILKITNGEKVSQHKLVKE
jgi:photosystem II stability/assembly factor-like uncharacterized protein